MDRQGQGHNQQHGDKIRRYDRHAPVKNCEDAQHQHRCYHAIEYRADHPPPVPKNDGQYQHHNANNGGTEGDQISPDKVEHIGGNHRHTADKDFRVGPELLGDSPHRCHHAAAPVVLRSEKLIVQRRYFCEFRDLSFSQLSGS